MANVQQYYSCYSLWRKLRCGVLKPGNEFASPASKSLGFLKMFIVGCLNVVNTSSRDLHVLFFNIKYISKYPTHEF